MTRFAFNQRHLERVSDVPCLLLILKSLIVLQKMFPQNCKKVKSTNEEHHKQDQSQNRDSILPNQSIVSNEGLHLDKRGIKYATQTKQMISCETWHDSGLQDSTKHFMCTLLDEMELVRNLGHRS